jgi:two-component system chemotaxis response regulator CheY
MGLTAIGFSSRAPGLAGWLLLTLSGLEQKLGEFRLDASRLSWHGSPPMPPQDSAQPIRVLVVDDDPRLVMAMSDVLVAEGYETKTAQNGEVAIRQLAAFSPDVMLLDMEMPKMDGFDVLRWLKTSGIEVAVVIASNNDDVSAEDVGAMFKLPKPFDLDQLLAALAAALERPSQT